MKSVVMICLCICIPVQANCPSADLTGDCQIDWEDVQVLASGWLSSAETVLMEDFESGDFTSIPWQHGGHADWIITSGVAIDGTYAARSGYISNNQSSTLEVTTETPSGTINFYVKVSSESWDHLAFFIDGEKQDQWAGDRWTHELDWSEQTYSINAGQHTFRWSYEKDGNASMGSDCAWIDAIAVCPSADLTGDCSVDLKDWSLLASQWITDPDIPVGPEGMVWVYIDDPGVAGHEGFTGYMSKYEVTNAQYCEYLNAAYAGGLIYVLNGRVYPAGGNAYRKYCDTYYADYDSGINYSNGVFSVRSPNGQSKADDPMVEVTWLGAKAFCDYYGFRLPTEWEWQAVADYDGTVTHTCEKCYGYGMCDMTGGVWEWTSSCRSECLYRVLRGRNCTLADWTRKGENYEGEDIGFRVCR